MSPKQFISLLLASILISVIFGCCSLPLINCGPEIVPVKVNPEKLEINCGDDQRTLSFKGWKYFLNNKGNVVYFDVNSDDYDQFDFKLYYINHKDTTFLEPSLKVYGANKQMFSYEVSRDSSFSELLLFIEFGSNDGRCRSNKHEIYLII